tara:strand:- start:41 stop:376 length:336 start_codon:yes stop_codon:yes gene_type:complete
LAFASFAPKVERFFRNRDLGEFATVAADIITNIIVLDTTERGRFGQLEEPFSVFGVHHGLDRFVFQFKVGDGVFCDLFNRLVVGGSARGTQDLRFTVTLVVCHSVRFDSCV